MTRNWPDIIRAAASSPLGIVALVVLILGGTVGSQRNHRAKTKGFRGLEMIVIDATKQTIAPSNSSPFASSMPNRDELDLVNDHLKLAESQSHPLERWPFRLP